MTSCSGWIVATMSRIGPTRGRSISSSRMREYSCVGAAGQRLVLVAGDLAPLEAEPPAQVHPHRLAGAAAVERQADRRPPVDDHRVAVGVGHVAAADVEPGAVLGMVLLVVEPPEEQRHGRVVLEGLHPRVHRRLEVHLADPVPGGRRVQPRRPLPHPRRGPSGRPPGGRARAPAHQGASAHGRTACNGFREPGILTGHEPPRLLDPLASTRTTGRPTRRTGRAPDPASS